MTFTHKNADLSTTIANFSYVGTQNYSIKYLDGSETHYFTSNPTEKEELLLAMEEQALERDANMALEDINIKKEMLTVLSIVSTLLCVVSLDKKEKLLSLLSFLLAGVSGSLAKDKIKQYIELSKYRIFLEMKDDIKKVNQGELLECIEFEHLYQKDLDINHLDEYSYRDIKRVRTQLNKMLQEKRR